jgi:nicotinate-nucleotide adenylyltransferase
VPSLGILGGSFNPPHIGHLALARDARDELGLDRVLLMPLHTPTHKHGAEDPGPEHRLAMCRLAAAPQPGIEACALEIERGGPSYTVDTLSEIDARCPEDELTFIVGADTALTMPGWREPERVLSLAKLAVASRPGSDRSQVQAALAQVPLPGGRKPDLVFLSMAPVAASSSRARELIAAGLPAGELLAPAVEGYIAEHHLYATEPAGR